MPLFTEHWEDLIASADAASRGVNALAAGFANLSSVFDDLAKQYPNWNPKRNKPLLEWIADRERTHTLRHRGRLRDR